MCAIFGFISRSKSGPNLKTLANIVNANIARGPHSFGFAWIDSRGRLHCFKQCGRLTDHLPLLAMLKDARMLIGHLRFATHGSPTDNINNHPHPSDGGWIVHNGVIHNHARLAEHYEVTPIGECDSEVLALMIEHEYESTLLRRCATSVRLTRGALAMMGLWGHKPELIVARRGNPLQIGETPDGVYLATNQLPASCKPQLVRDNTIRTFTRMKGSGIKCRTIKLKNPVERFAAGLYDDEGEYVGG